MAVLHDAPDAIKMFSFEGLLPRCDLCSQLVDSLFRWVTYQLAYVTDLYLSICLSMAWAIWRHCLRGFREQDYPVDFGADVRKCWLCP